MSTERLARVEIGAVCWKGHYMFNADPEGVACGTKAVGRIYVEWSTDEPYFGGGTPEELLEECDASLAAKIDAWRKS